MPKLQAEDKTKVTPCTLRLREDVQRQLEAYGAYLNPEDPSSPEHVITECFKAIAGQDKDFTKFLETYKPKEKGKQKPGRKPQISVAA